MVDTLTPPGPTKTMLGVLDPGGQLRRRFNAGLLTSAVEQLRTTGFEIDDDVSHLGRLTLTRYTG